MGDPAVKLVHYSPIQNKTFAKMKVLNRPPKRGHFHLNYEIGNFVYKSTLTSRGKKTVYSYQALPTMQADSFLYQLSH